MLECRDPLLIQEDETDISSRHRWTRVPSGWDGKSPPSVPCGQLCSSFRKFPLKSPMNIAKVMFSSPFCSRLLLTLGGPFYAALEEGEKMLLPP